MVEISKWSKGSAIWWGESGSDVTGITQTPVTFVASLMQAAAGGLLHLFEHAIEIEGGWLLARREL